MNREKLKESLMLSSFFLHYPDEAFLGAIQESRELLENELDEDLQPFYTYIKQSSLTELSENFVDTFDFGRKVNLYMAYSKVGDDRARGHALIELKKLYSEEDLYLAENELPDYLPLMLEFAAISRTDIGLELLHQHMDRLVSLKEGLMEMDSPYVFILLNILSLLEQWQDSHSSKEVVS